MKQKRKDALQELLAKVEAGNCSNNGIMFGVFGDEWLECFDAYNGSLDAALALHDAVLPGWAWCLESDDQAILSCREDHTEIYAQWTSRANPARGWLIAILKALIAECEV